MLSPQFLDELRARTTLSTLIGRTVKITRAGREWKACCPFHNEKTSSFTINDETGFYHWLAAAPVVMTSYGRRLLRDLAGTTASVARTSVVQGTGVSVRVDHGGGVVSTKKNQ